MKSCIYGIIIRFGEDQRGALFVIIVEVRLASFTTAQI